MKRDKHFYKEKAIRKLKKELDTVRDAIRSQGLIELDKPIHNGYNATWVLRADISRRDDAHVYQEALDACNTVLWCKKPDFKYKNWKTKKMDHHNPSLKPIHKADYEKLSIRAKKFFHEDLGRYWRIGYSDKVYVCSLSFELVVKVSKSYITHRQEHDGLLYQKEAENKDQLFLKADGHPWGENYRTDGFWKKHEFKKEKLKEERKIVEVKKVYKGKSTKNDLLDL